ncbi:MAG TPA: hypothetical protein VLF93_04480 [Candidatus Saccharimonadales bacterium]|nr:hypothetical protein [Candidatus Saccharimonadales bacterium]
MATNSTNKKASLICSQCGSELIFVSRESVKPEGMRYAQTNTVYRCSNDECQKKKNKDKADREKLRLNKEENDKLRQVKNQELRNLGKQAKQAEH